MKDNHKGNGVNRRVGVYIGWSGRFRNDGWELFGRKDYTQASEKFWGAVSQIIKAIAERRGWVHDGHAKFFKIIDKLADELKDEEILTLFHVANSLHINFYEHWLTPNEVNAGAKAVERLIERLKPLLNKR